MKATIQIRVLKEKNRYQRPHLKRSLSYRVYLNHNNLRRKQLTRYKSSLIENSIKLLSIKRLKIIIIRIIAPILSLISKNLKISRVGQLLLLIGQLITLYRHQYRPLLTLKSSNYCQRLHLRNKRRMSTQHDRVKG